MVLTIVFLAIRNFYLADQIRHMRYIMKSALNNPKKHELETILHFASVYQYAYAKTVRQVYLLKVILLETWSKAKSNELAKFNKSEEYYEELRAKYGDFDSAPILGALTIKEAIENGKIFKEQLDRFTEKV